MDNAKKIARTLYENEGWRKAKIREICNIDRTVLINKDGSIMIVNKKIFECFKTILKNKKTKKRTIDGIYNKIYGITKLYKINN